MAVQEIMIHDKKYKIACNDEQVEHLFFLSKRLSERVKKKSKLIGGIVSSNTLLVLAALELENEIYENESNKDKDFNNYENNESLIDLKNKLKSIIEQIEATDRQ